MPPHEMANNSPKTRPQSPRLSPPNVLPPLQGLFPNPSNALASTLGRNRQQKHGSREINGVKRDPEELDTAKEPGGTTDPCCVLLAARHTHPQCPRRHACGRHKLGSQPGEPCPAARSLWHGPSRSCGVRRQSLLCSHRSAIGSSTAHCVGSPGLTGQWMDALVRKG